MNITKEQMLEWLEMECANCSCAPRGSEVCREQEDIDQCLSTVAALEALIESSGERASGGGVVFHAWKERAERAESELAKQAPLIEAVMASIKRVLDFKPFWQKFDHSGFMNSTQLSDRDLFMKLMADCRAALALREEKK